MKNKIIFSVEHHSKRDSLNLRNHLSTQHYLETIGVKFQILEGHYQHLDGTKTEELSFLIDSPTDKERQFVFNLAGMFNQESILEIVKEEGTLLYLNDGLTINIGKAITTKNSDIAETYENYSWNRTKKEYLIVG